MQTSSTAAILIGFARNFLSLLFTLSEGGGQTDELRFTNKLFQRNMRVEYVKIMFDFRFSIHLDQILNQSL